MPNWACEFDSHLGHSITEVVDFQRLPLFFIPKIADLFWVNVKQVVFCVPLITWEKNEPKS